MLSKRWSLCPGSDITSLAGHRPGEDRRQVRPDPPSRWRNVRARALRPARPPSLPHWLGGSTRHACDADAALPARGGARDARGGASAHAQASGTGSGPGKGGGGVPGFLGYLRGRGWGVRGGDGGGSCSGDNDSGFSR
ncbi:hypothetical protein VULLAG_LOCUS10400 [Vulpes lagopus]